MTIERTLRLVAGAFVLLSLALGVEGSPIFLSQHALWFTAFVGLNLLQSGFSNWCPMISILRKLGMKSGELAHA
jgi:hypothetical protein